MYLSNIVLSRDLNRDLGHKGIDWFGGFAVHAVFSKYASRGSSRARSNASCACELLGYALGCLYVCLYSQFMVFMSSKAVLFRAGYAGWVFAEAFMLQHKCLYAYMW